MNHSNAHIRYKALDACLRNRQRKYFFYDLLDAVNEALRSHGEEDVSERTLRADLVRLESEAIGGQDIEIEKLYDGHRVYYRYRDPNFSLFNPIISQQEAELLSETINLLLRFKGFPQFDWLDETLARLRQTFHLDGTEEGMVSFMQNPDLNGLGHFGRLFDAIVHHEVLAIDYHRFGRPVRTRIIHPYQLRQWNNRWYLVGYEKRQGGRFPYVVLPLDRIIKVNG